VSNTVGEKIRQLRVISGLSQENVSEEIGMSYGNYGKIERGEIDVSSTHLIAIAKVLKVNVCAIFETKQGINSSEPKLHYGYATKDELLDLATSIIKLTKTVEHIEKQLLASRASGTKKVAVKKKPVKK
jgi:transcriptional regulator with XRE-family HTH domain